ncbi:MAG TPA: TolC family protein [Fibrobacteria bacterium]|nr:TolC family protein [Fibrobacteria bacterium]
MSSLILAIAFAGAFAAPPDSTTDPVQTWVDLARRQHPQGMATADMVASRRGPLAGAGAWMPPSAQLDLRSDGAVDLSLSQMIPGPGKTSDLRRVREAQLRMALADSAEEIRKMELAVREAAWMEWMAWEKLQVLAAQESLAVVLAATVRRSQSQGMATAAEAWLADTRSRQLRLQKEQALAEARAASAMRESWTGTETSRMVPGPPVAPGWNDSDLVRLASERPDILSMAADAAMEESMAVSMRTSLRPDFMVGAMAMRMSDGMPGWGVMAGMTLPFVPWARGMAVGESSQARAKARVARAGGEAMRRMAVSEIVGHSRKARAAWEALRELDATILPGQEAALQDARTRFGQGREMLAMVLAMEDMVRMARMERLMRRGDYELERSRLAAAAGVAIANLEGEE